MSKYFPYLRGKQFELLAIRESSEVIARNDFMPIIEPVRSATSGLGRVLSALDEAQGKCCVIINSQLGSAPSSGESLNFLEGYRDSDRVVPAILFPSDLHDVVTQRIQEWGRVVVVHRGMASREDVDSLLAWLPDTQVHVFHDDHTSTLYRRRYYGKTRVLLNDGFLRVESNSRYPYSSPFSDLYLTYGDQGVEGFGDFLTVGDDYREGGGPAYAVALHITYIDAEQDYALAIRHFISDTNDTPTDPANKFAEALSKLAADVNGPNSEIPRTEAIEEFLALHSRGHFPGLGYVKKLSVKHHLEVVAQALAASP